MTVIASFATFRARPGVTCLWFEYRVDAVRNGRPQAVEVARDVFVLLVGELVAQFTAPIPPARTCARIAARLSGADRAAL